MYTIIFQDGTCFEGGDLQNSLWNQIPDKPIKELYYKIGNNILKLKGYERYNHLIERASALFVKKSQISGIYILGERKDCVEKFYINLRTNKLEHSFTKFGQECKGRMTPGWKQGLPNLNPTYTLI